MKIYIPQMRWLLYTPTLYSQTRMTTYHTQLPQYNENSCDKSRSPGRGGQQSKRPQAPLPSLLSSVDHGFHSSMQRDAPTVHAAPKGSGRHQACSCEQGPLGKVNVLTEDPALRFLQPPGDLSRRHISSYVLLAQPVPQPLPKTQRKWSQS